eukprot:15594758-Heterocapsa_arctica.AAC.1
MDLGWQPKQLWQWTDPGGQEWALDPNDGSLWQDLRQELISTITTKVWEKAALHYLGQGLEAGVDWDSTLRHLRKLDKTDPTKTGILKAIAQGGISPAERKFQANYIDTEICP